MATIRFAMVALLASGLAGPSRQVDPEPASPGLAATIERLVEQREYEATENGVGLQAPNRAHDLRSYFEPTGVVVVDRTAPAPAELLALRIAGLGRAEALAPVPAGEVSSAGARVEIRRPGLVEWYVNSVAGLEQGFTLDAPPAGTGELVIELEVEHARGRLLGNRVRFESETGRRLEYAKLVVTDADGRTLPARLELPEPGRLHLVADDVGASYPIVVDPLLTNAYDSVIYSEFSEGRLGVSVASAGDVNGDGFADVIVGAHQYDAGQATEGIALVFHGGPGGIGVTSVVDDADALIQSNEIGAELGIRVASAGDVNNDGYGDVIVGAHFYGPNAEGAAFVYLGSPSGIVPAGNPSNPNAALEANQGGANFGENVASAGDVNGDGYSDVIVGAPFYDSSQVWEGSAFIFHGSATGITSGNQTTAATELEGNQAGMQFGMGVAGAGDVNGDGYGDVIVGGPFFGTPIEGAAFVFHGSASGVPPATAHGSQSRIRSNQTTGTLAAQLGWSVAGAGDVNGDGYADVIVGAHTYDNGSTDEGIALVFHGSATGIVASGHPGNANATLESNQPGANLGNAVAGAGDVNGDGYADVIVGAPNYDNPTSNEGNAFVFVGGPSGIGNGSPSNAFATVDVAGGVSNNLGFAVAGAGDVNGDGYADVIVGAWQGDPIEDDEGFALVYHGGAKGITSGNPVSAARLIESNQGEASFGYGLASAGDVNGDGYGDLIVGAFNYDDGGGNEGAAFVFHGSNAGITATNVTLAASTILGDDPNDALGYSVASAGDVNGDGYGDVVVGAPGVDDSNENEGAAYIFHGSAAGIVATGSQANANSVIQTNQDDALLGYSVAPAGDVNGDGYGDVLVGTPYYNNTDVDEGVAFVYEGGPSGIGPVGTPGNADSVIEGNATGIGMGYSLDGVGDLNGDGYADVAVGAVYYTEGEASEGGVFVYHGGPSGITPSGDPGNANAVFQSNQITAAAGSSVSGAGDVNGDGYDDLITGVSLYAAEPLPGTSEGAAFVFHGGASGIGAANPSNADAVFQSDQASAFLGGSVDGAGDVNGDGYADVIVGAEGYNNNKVPEGAAFVFLGSSTGLSSGGPMTASALLENNQTPDPLFGLAAGIGDVNGDGFADVAVAARNYDNPTTDEGAVALFYGGGNRTGRPVLARQMDVGTSVPIAPWGVSNSYQGFDASITATHPLGRGLVRLQVEACPVSVAFGQGSCVIQTQPSWTSIIPPGSYAVLTHTVVGLDPETLYHWRARVLHRQPGSGLTASTSAHGPWRRLQAFASNADFGTPAIPDTDSDGVLDDTDNCISVPNPSQLDSDVDGQGNACDTDDDNDYLLDVFETNTGIYVSTGNTGSDPLDADSDDDGFRDGFEVRGHANPNDAHSQPLFLGFDQLDGGQYFTCGVLTNGELACFGNVPPGMPSGTYTSVTTGVFLAPYFACALATNDSIVCWGSGAATTPPSTDYLQIAAGGQHVCGLLPDLTLECWGSDSSGETNPPPGQFTEVASGIFHSCALALDGSPHCWGSNSGGQIDVPAGETFTQIVAGNSHSCGLRADGSVVCWGANAVGQLDVPGGTFTQIVAGGSQNCGILSSGEVLCWGSNTFGQTVEPSGVFAAVFAGPNHTCGVRPDHFVECWGRDLEGQATPLVRPFPEVALGEEHGCELAPAGSIRCFGSNGDGRSSPPSTDPIGAIGVGARHSCAIEDDGDLVCFGDDDDGQGASQAAGGDPFVQVDGGYNHTCSVRASGAVMCWGTNNQGQSAPDAGNYRQVSAGGMDDGDRHTCGVTTSGAIQCWGGNGEGQATDQAGTWQHVSAGTDFSCGVRSNGTLGCWGSNVFGKATPPGVGHFTQVEAGSSHACALAANGTVECWGDGSDDQTDVPPGSFRRIAAGGDTSCGVLEDGSIVCWGDDGEGQASPPLEGDGDGRAEGADNCPVNGNFSQGDADVDGVGDACDFCDDVPDPDQFDRDDDGVGDACDNCLDVYNSEQEDDDDNGIGNACEDTLVIIRPFVPPPPPGPPPGAPFGPGPPPPPPAGQALYDVFLYCPAESIEGVQLGVIVPENAVPSDVDFGLGCTPANCSAAVGHGLGATVNPLTSFASGPGLATPGAQPDTVYFSVQATAGQVLCPNSEAVPEYEVRVAQFEIANPLPDMPTPSLTTEGLTAVGLIEPLTDDTGRVLEPAEYSFASVNQDPQVLLTLEPAAGGVPGHRWQVELDTNIELHRVTFGLVAPTGTNTSQIRFIGCTTASGPQPTRRSCLANNALGPYVNPATSFTVGPGASTSGLRTDTLYVSVEGLRPSPAPLDALNVAGQPVLLGVVEIDTTTAAPAMTLDGVGTTAVFGEAYVTSDPDNTAVTTPFVQVGSGYNAPSDYDADGRSDDLDNCPFTANVTQANNGGFMTTDPDLYGDLCQCADGDGNGAVGFPASAADTAALRAVLTGTGSAAVASRCSVAGGPECDIRDYAVFKRALAGLGPGISSVCASAVQGSQLP